jgi:hypothetical protein
MENEIKGKGDIQFRVDFEGRWFGPDGKEVNEASLFFLTQNLRGDKEGFFVGMGFGPAKLIVEDVPLHVCGIELIEKRGSKEIEITFLGGGSELLDPETLFKRGDHFYCRVRGGRIPARFTGSAQEGLLNYLKADGDDIYLVL